jgi:restriction system protein
MEINFLEILKNSLLIVLKVWQIWVLIIAIIIFKVMIEIVLPKEIKSFKNALNFNKGEKWRSDRDKLTWLRGLSPKEFEDYIAELFNRLGYKAYAVGGLNDGGIDVIAEKDGKKHYIQCKKYFKAREVSVGDVRDFYGALADKLSNSKAYFITTSKFTLPAEEFTGDKPIELVDGNKLLEYIKLANPKGEEEIKSDICPKCGGILKKRDGKYGSFMGCSNYPRCRFISKT